MSKVCAIYARVSSALQDVENSVSAQVSACKKYADAHGYSICNIYTDEVKSGKTENRPAFKELIKDAKAKKFQVFLADKQDRFFISDSYFK